MKEQFEGFLIDQNILPYEGWNKIIVNHEEGYNQMEVKDHIRKEIKDEDSGVYIYTNDRGEVLYIGEGKLKSRLLRHYKKSYKKQINSPRHHFFQERKEKMTVYYKLMNDKYERLAIEAMLTVVLEPSYIKTLKNK